MLSVWLCSLSIKTANHSYPNVGDKFPSVSSVGDLLATKNQKKPSYVYLVEVNKVYGVLTIDYQKRFLTQRIFTITFVHLIKRCYNLLIAYGFKGGGCTTALFCDRDFL